jgi:ribonuclease HI
MQEVLVYADGSSSGVGDAPGGYGAVLLYESSDGRTTMRKELSGGELSTTNNRQEMLAAIVALETIRPGRYRVVVHSDSAYLVNCMRRGWIALWRERGWRTSAKGEVANRDLWERLEAAVARHPEVAWQKVKGHSKAATEHARLNNRADQLAVAAKRKCEREGKVRG